MSWILLFIAIVAEVVATTTLNSTEGFTRLWPSILVFVCYETAFIAMTFAIKKIPIGIVFAIWTGVGVALVALIGWIRLNQPLLLMDMLGLALIILGTLVIRLLSKTQVDS